MQRLNVTTLELVWHSRTKSDIQIVNTYVRNLIADWLLVIIMISQCVVLTSVYKIFHLSESSKNVFDLLNNWILFRNYVQNIEDICMSGRPDQLSIAKIYLVEVVPIPPGIGKVLCPNAKSYILLKELIGKFWYIHHKLHLAPSLDQIFAELS